MRINGVNVRLDFKKFIKSSTNAKIKTIKIIVDSYKERFFNYWIGYVDVSVRNIHGSFDDGKKTKISHVSIISGRFGTAYVLNNVTLETINSVLLAWKDSNSKNFTLEISYSNGFYQSCDFTKKQKDILLKQFEDISKMDWYVEE